MAEQKLRVYLETSFVSYLTGGETDNAKIASDQAYSRQCWRLDMSDTAIIDEVRAIRRQIAEECGNDLRKITEHAKEVTRRFLGQPKLSAV